ncbi:conserved unknown protein [Ectocarpus siliculosus]|uniref:Nuclear cap-binding protein subunit 1 n=1 Tax=Ectocarpus siliculosus TaxID=2880 RepID=D8LFZ4_ECTSI|nr:conserved unknown protein [Ectocarpus siliculosus]|eukprot:CBN78893.1 conserved unknown protein [Ectocarpus siliculosus]
MSKRSRERSRSPPGRRYSSGSAYGNGNRRHSGGREDPRAGKLRAIKQLLAEPAEPRSGYAKDPPEERAVELARMLSARRYLDGGADMEDVATLLVEAAGTLSIQTPVYALTTALCVASAKSPKRSGSREREGGGDGGGGDDNDGNAATARDSMVTDDAADSREDGPSFGRLVVDGCCHAFAEALRKGGFIRAKLLLRFLGELLNCGLVEAQEYGDMLAMLCAGYVKTEAWVAGFSNLMDELRLFMSGRHAPFRLNSLRAVFVTPEDDEEEEEAQGGNPGADGEDRQGDQPKQPMEDSLSILWEVVSALHDSGWNEDDLPRATPRVWKTPTAEPRLSNLSSLSLPDDFVTSDTIPAELTGMGPCEMAACAGVDVGTTSPADRPDWSYALGIMGERDLFDEDDGVGPASCCPELLPKKERVVLVEYCKDILACFQPVCRADGTKVGKWAMLVDQLVSIRDSAPSGCQVAYLITEVLFLAMLQLPAAEHLAISCHRTILELCRIVPKEAPAAVSYCTGRLFDELERLDSTVASRFGTWFADHLKNTEYKWPFWKHWCNVVELQPDNAQRVFVSNVLAALVKLSYTDRIKKTLPEALWPLLPLDPTPVCPYLDGATGIPASLQRIAADLSSRVSSREDVEDLQVLLRGGQASPTHTFVYLDRYRSYLRTLRRDEALGEANQVAMLDGVAQLWEHSPQWFCLVCKYLLDIGVLSPTTVVYYVFREDNNNAIALSPFLWEVMSKAISLYTDRVTLSLGELRDLEKSAKALDEAIDERLKNRSPVPSTEEGDDNAPPADPQDVEEKQRMSNDIEDQRDVVREAVQQARALCTATVSSFVQALANALPQYAANGMTDFSADPWWVSMTSYLKGSLSLFSALPGVPARHFTAATEDDDEGEEEAVEEEEERRILTAGEVEELATAAGCLEHVEAIVVDLKGMA